MLKEKVKEYGEVNKDKINALVFKGGVQV